MSLSYPHSGGRWASAIRIQRRRWASSYHAFEEPVDVSYPHSESRWTSAIRIQGVGGRELHAFEEPVDVSYPHSGRRWARATRIRGAGGRQLSAFRGPVGVSYPHSAAPVGVSYPHWRGRRELSALTGLVEGTLRGQCRDGGPGCAARDAPVLPVGGRRACRLKPAFQAGRAHRVVPGWSARWHEAVPAARVSRFRAMPAGGRRSEPLRRDCR